MNFLALAAATLASLGLWLLLANMRAAKSRRVARSMYFSEAAQLFDSFADRPEPSGFPRMTGKLAGHAFDLQAVPDSLTFRKLPTLWVMVSLPERLPVRATLDIMARVTGHEPFSHFSTLQQSLPPTP